MYFTKLTCTTRLFFMAIVCTSRLRNSFTIRDSRLFILDLQFFIIFQTPLQRTQVELTLSVNNSLTQLFGLLYHPSRIFLTHAVKDNHHFFRIGFIQRLDSTRVFRIRILNKIETVFSAFTIQSISGMHIFQFHGTANITGYHFFYLDTVSTRTGIYLGDTFF